MTNPTPTQPDWIDRLYELYEEGRKNGAPQSYIDYFNVRSFIQSVADTSYEAGYKKRVQEEINGVEETAVEIVQKEAVDTFRLVSSVSIRHPNKK